MAASFSTTASISPLEKLSDREFEVFLLSGEGKTAKEIAGQLNLSPQKTIGYSPAPRSPSAPAW
jgi:DNA-binding CsgD family transcriptional regulator